MNYFLVTYDGPTESDELNVMVVIQSPRYNSMLICYKTYLVKTELNAYQLGKEFMSQLEAKGTKLKDSDKIFIAQVSIDSTTPTYAWHGIYDEALKNLLRPIELVPSFSDEG